MLSRWNCRGGDMKKKELIRYCKTRESEVCNGCPYFKRECMTFYKQEGLLPYFVEEEDVTGDLELSE